MKTCNNRIVFLLIAVALGVLICGMGFAAEESSKDLKEGDLAKHAQKIYVVPAGCENTVLSLLPDNMLLTGGFKITDRQVEKSDILVELASKSEKITVKMVHISRDMNAVAKTGKFAFILVAGKKDKALAAINDLAQKVAAIEDKWEWAVAYSEVDNLMSEERTKSLKYISPECSDSMKAMKEQFKQAKEGMKSLAAQYEKLKSKEAQCANRQLVFVMDKADISLSEWIDNKIAAIGKLEHYPNVVLSWGYYYLRNEQFDKVRKIWTEQIDRFPDSLDIAWQLSKTVVMTGYGDADYEFYEKKLKENPDSVSLNYMYAMLKYYKRDYKTALNNFEICLKGLKTSEDLFIYLAMCNYYLKNEAKAFEYLNKADKINEQSGKSYYVRALMALSKEDKNEATKNLEKYIEMVKKSATVDKSKEAIGKEAVDLLDYLKNWQEDSGVSIFAPLDMMAPWPNIEPLNKNVWKQEKN